MAVPGGTAVATQFGFVTTVCVWLSSFIPSFNLLYFLFILLFILFTASGRKAYKKRKEGRVARLRREKTLENCSLHAALKYADDKIAAIQNTSEKTDFDLARFQALTVHRDSVLHELATPFDAKPTILPLPASFFPIFLQ